MLSSNQKEFLIQELNRFTRFHGIRPERNYQPDEIEHLSDFSLRRKKIILYEAIIWCVILLLSVSVFIFRRKPLNFSASVIFATMISGSFALLLRAMYALGRNRKFRLIVKLMQLEILNP